MKTILGIIALTMWTAFGGLTAVAQDAAAPAAAEAAVPAAEAAPAAEAPAEEAPKPLDPGHQAWQMTSTALVLFMTLPGLALFYGGLVRKKNVLSVLAQCLGIAGMVTILWWLCGYSLAFSGAGKFIGNLDMIFFRGIDVAKTGKAARTSPTGSG